MIDDFEKGGVRSTNKQRVLARIMKIAFKVDRPRSPTRLITTLFSEQ